MNYLLVFLGGGLGSICRYGIAVALKNYAFQFPYATLLANIISCIILGYVLTIGQKNILSSNILLFFVTGFCGGFSTFSTFSAETFVLFNEGQFAYGLFNIFASISICLFCIYIGIKLGN